MEFSQAKEQYEMIKAAVADNPAFAVSSMEIEERVKPIRLTHCPEIKNNPNTEIYFFCYGR